MNPQKEAFSHSNVQILKIHQSLLESLNARNYVAFQSLLKKGLKKHPRSLILNYVYPPPVDKTLLEIACCEGYQEFVSLLLENLEQVEDINRINESFNRGLLHFAVEEDRTDVLEVRNF